MRKYRYSEAEQDFIEKSSVPFAVYQFIDNKVITVALSRGFIELSGYTGMTKEEVYGLMDSNMYQDTHPDDLSAIGEAVLSFATGEKAYDVVYRFKRDGEYRIIHSYGQHIYKENGVKLAVIWYRDLGPYIADGSDEKNIINGCDDHVDTNITMGSSRDSTELRIISGEYVKLKKENEKLKEEADAGKKIAELKRSVSALLTNMPAITFSKDVHTRKYLACNQAFADYANKETPEDVVGLTDFEIFDSDTAYHFIEDDKKALAMDRPYIFYEDVPDAGGNPRQFQTTKLKFTDDTGRECLLGLCQDVTDAMRIKREYVEKLAMVQSMAEIDALTGIKNKNAYKEREELMNRRIRERRQPEFAIIVLDVNDLKTINDTLGHEAGDKCICEACDIICRTFKRSPVYRVGGDEFVVISQDEDYDRTDELIGLIARHNEEAIEKGGIIIACGMSRYDNDEDVITVFNRADKIMYDNKSYLKKRKV
ncbi:diguanylate cyclase (GGDEF) domain-containing protein [Lachnospiraceae bacterium JC7]|nr:diguanylate cyclase (GGDEF) domain-containing protein [Lachnospiraceae bacterium JC7]